MNEKVQNNNVYINGNVTPYANIEHLLREATRLTRKDNGVSEKLTPTDKMIYVEMRDKFFSYTSQGKEYYENHDQIAAAVGVGVATTYRSIKKWENLGLITRNQIRTKLGHLSNSYSVKSFSYEVENFFIEGVKGDISLPTSGLHGESQPEAPPVEICEAMPEQESRIKAAPQEEQHAMVLQPAEKHEPDAVRPPPSTPERDRDMNLDFDELLGNENGRKQGEPPQEEREEEYTYRFTKTKVPIPAGINPDDPDSWDEDSLPF